MNIAGHLRTLLTFAVMCAVAGLAPTASANISRPGDHVHYSVDLEPHLILQWAQEEGYDEGFGFGLRASFVLLDNGPVPSINNTLALSTGLDLTFFSENCVYAGRGYDCDALQVWVPIAAQWNFYLTESFALFPELGFAFQYVNHDNDGYCRVNVAGVRVGYCDDSDLDVEPVFWLGGRYAFNDAIGITFRLGYPSITVGASLFL